MGSVKVEWYEQRQTTLNDCAEWMARASEQHLRNERRALLIGSDHEMRLVQRMRENSYRPISPWIDYTHDAVRKRTIVRRFDDAYRDHVAMFGWSGSMTAPVAPLPKVRNRVKPPVSRRSTLKMRRRRRELRRARKLRQNPT